MVPQGVLGDLILGGSPLVSSILSHVVDHLGLIGIFIFRCVDHIFEDLGIFEDGF